MVQQSEKTSFHNQWNAQNIWKYPNLVMTNTKKQKQWNVLSPRFELYCKSFAEMYKILLPARKRNRLEYVVVLEHIKKPQSAAKKIAHGNFGAWKEVFDYRRLPMGWAKLAAVLTKQNYNYLTSRRTEINKKNDNGKVGYKYLNMPSLSLFETEFYFLLLFYISRH